METEERCTGDLSLLHEVLVHAESPRAPASSNPLSPSAKILLQHRQAADTDVTVSSMHFLALIVPQIIMLTILSHHLIHILARQITSRKEIPVQYTMLRNTPFKY